MSKIYQLITWLLLVLGGSGAAHAHVLNLDYSAFTLSKLLCNQDYLVPELECGDWRGAVAIDADFSAGSFLGLKPFMENKVHGEGSEAKFKTVGWHYVLGIAIPSAGVDIGWEHHSRHSLDQKPPHVFDHDWKNLVENKFPIYDAIILRFILTGKAK